MKKESIEDKYIKNLIDKKVKVSLATIDGLYYQGFIVGMSENSILFKDKFDQELMFFFKDIRRIVPYKDNKKSRLNKGGEGEGSSGS